MKIIIVTFFLLIFNTLVRADYQFNNVTASLTNITDSTLSEDLKGQTFSTQLSVDVKQTFFVAGAVSVTAYDEKIINDIFIDYAANSADIKLGMYQTFNNNNKVFGYLGFALINSELAVDSETVTDSESLMLYGFGLIAAINPQIDLLMSVDIDTLNSQNNQAFSAGLSFDLDTIAAIQTIFTQQDDIKALSIGIRFNYE